MSVMSSKSEREAEWFRANVLPDLLRSDKFVHNYRADLSDTLKVTKIDVSFIGAEEAFMLTICYRISVEFEFAGQTQTRRLVVKKTPALPDDIFDSINFAALFSNEVQAYNVILPAIERFAAKPIVAPVSYYSDLQRSFCAIVLDDFGPHGWRLSHDKVNLSLDHILIAVKYLARFHGLGFAMRQTDREVFDRLTAGLKESRYAHDFHDDWTLTVRESHKRLMTATRHHQPQISEEFLQRLDLLIGEHFRYGKQRVQPIEPMATLCHGDYLRNNIAYKYQENGQPIDIMMFDLQTMRVSSPMIDLAVFLGLSAFAEVRCAHFGTIFQAYVTELAAAFTTHAQSELPDFLSHESLLKEYIRFVPYSISVAASFLGALVAPGNQSSEEFLLDQRTAEEKIADVHKRGGETVNREIAHQVKELYDLCSEHGADFCEGFEWCT